MKALPGEIATLGGHDGDHGYTSPPSTADGVGGENRGGSNVAHLSNSGLIRREVNTHLSELYPLRTHAAELLRVIEGAVVPRHLFVTYAGEAWYAHHYTSPGSRSFERPTELGFMGVYKHGDSWGLKVGCTFDANRLRSPEDAEEISLRLRSQADAIADQTEISSISYAGVLPGIMFKARIRRVIPERAVTAAAVATAVSELQRRCGIDDPLLLLLGGNGFIGRVLGPLLKGSRLRVIDRGVGCIKSDLYEAMGPVVIINVASSEALVGLENLLPADSAVLNEAYPPPGAETIARFKCRGVRMFHVAGLAGEAWPDFPRAYSGAIPCCAAIPGSPINPVLVEMT